MNDAVYKANQQDMLEIVSSWLWDFTLLTPLLGQNEGVGAANHPGSRAQPI